MTWLEIRSEIYRCLGQTEEDPHWQPSELLRRANIHQRKIARRAQCLMSSSNVSLLTGVYEYDQPAGCLMVTRVVIAEKPLTETTIDHLDAIVQSGRKPNTFIIPGVYDPTWSTDKWSEMTGEPTHYYQRVGGRIGVYPTPDADYTMAVDHVILPTDMAGDDDSPFNGSDWLTEFHDLIAYGVVADCLMENNNQGDALRARTFGRKYDDGVKEMYIHIRKRPRLAQTFGLLGRG